MPGLSSAPKPAKQLALAALQSTRFRAAATSVLFTLGLFASLTTVQSANQEPLVVAYLASWRNGPAALSNVSAEKLTHLNYAFGQITEDGMASLADPCLDVGECSGNEGAYPGGNFAAIKALKDKYPHLRSLIAIGGWLGSKYFSDVAATAESRKRFVDSCIDLYFMQHPGVFDGIDIDWEFPVQGGAQGNGARAQDRENFTLLIAEFRRQLNELQSSTHQLILTIAITGSPEGFANLELRKLAGLVDWMNVMTYDYHTGSTYTHFNAPLFETASDPTPALNVQASVQALLERGVPTSKIVVGVPFYGRKYGRVANNNNGLFQACDRLSAAACGDAIEYSELPGMLTGGFKRFWDEKAQVPWLFSSQSQIWITYDDPDSIRRKAKYVEEHRLRGVMIWELTQGDDSLLQAIRNGLGL